jgi:radical SAM superfamily enzyme YgiQ (UPF0313 family)
MIFAEAHPSRPAGGLPAEPLDLLLIDPPYKGLKGVGPECGYTLGLAYLAGYLRAAGMNVAILTGDLMAGAPRASFLNFSVKKYAEGQKLYEAALDGPHTVWERIAATVRRHRPRAVGITYLSPTKAAVEKIAALVKAVDPGIKVVVGGHHAAFCPEEILENHCVDFVIRGEGEEPLRRLVEELKKDAPAFGSVPGLHYRAAAGSIIATADAEQTADLDSLPFPARDLVLECDYGALHTHLVVTARGCPYACTFCSDRRLWRGKVRRRGVANVIEELVSLQRDYRVKTVHFVDGTFTFDRRYVLELCAAMVAAGLRFRWLCTARYDNIDAEMLSAMKAAGCAALYFGLESGSPRVLDAVGKRITVTEIVKKSRLVRNSGLVSMASVLLGVPGETDQDIEATLRLMRVAAVDLFDVNCYVPLPGTVLFDGLSAAQRDGIDWRRLAYKTIEGQFTTDVPAAEMRRLTAEAHNIAARRRRSFLFRIAWRKLREKAGALSAT